MAKENFEASCRRIVNHELMSLYNPPWLFNRKSALPISPKFAPITMFSKK